ISYSIRVRTTDSQANSIDENYTITIEDLDDLATLDFELSNNTINENAANGTFVGTLSPINASIAAQVNFQLIAGAGDTDNALFNRSGRDIFLNGMADFETKKTYSIRVEADDQGALVEKILLIQVNDVNESPTLVNVSTTTIQENNVVGQVVAVLSTDDPDEGDTFTYFFASAEPEFTIDGNLIKANESFNFERVPPINYNVTIRSRDAGFQFSPDRMISFVITNQNEAPTDVSLSSSSIFENNAAGSLVGTASTTDEDAGDTFTYSVVSGFGDDDKFEFLGNQLQSTELFNHEERSSYSIRIQTEDAAGAQFVKDYTISISDAAEVPFDLEISNSSIDENNSVSDLIGTLSAQDPDNGDTFSYFVLTSPADGFSFDIANGNELVADEAFDFEAKASYTIDIQVRDQTNRSYTESFTIDINDIFEDSNNAPTDISLSDNAFEETRSVGYTIGSFSTTDSDAGETYTYSLVNGTGDDDNDNFSIAGSQLKVNASFNFETQSTHSIRVKTEDGNGGELEKEFSIQIENDPEAPTNITISSSSIDESNSIGDVIGTFTTEDEDNGDTHTYEILTIGGSSDHTAFTIDNDNLEAAVVFDFETQSSYTIRIRTEDAIGDRFTKDFVISVTDVVENNDPTDISLSANAIDENNDVNDIIGTLSSTDADGSDTHTYSLVTNPGNSFNINNNELRASESFDFETADSYDIRIETEDQNGGVFEKDFTISINDVNENQAPTAIALSQSDVDENNSVGATIATLTSTDLNAGDTHIYSLQNFLAIFTIEGDQLKADVAFDFEDRDSYTISIQTDDQNGGTFTQDLTISVNDINDNAPSDFALTATTIDENNNIGDLVGLLSTTDADAVDSHTYSLVSNPGFYFRIVGNRLEANALFNFESEDSYDITISTSDGESAFQKEITISINDINDLPTNVGLTNASIDEDNALDDLVGILGTADEDAGATHTYTLESNPGSAFKINGNRLEANAVFDFDTQSSYPITVRSTDNSGGLLEEDFTITIVAEVDNLGPQIVSFTPVDGTEGILQSQQLVVTFNEPVQFGTGLIQVIRGGGSNQQVISTSGTSGQDVISINGSELTIHLDGDDRMRDLFFGSEYYVTISATAIRDVSNNALTNPITDQSTWTFFADKEPTNIVFDAIPDKFDNAIPFDISTTTNNVQTSVVYSILSGPATISGNTITLTGATGTVNVQALQVSTQRFKAANVATSFQVTEVPDTDAPQIVSFTPNDDADEVPLGSDLVVTFNEPIQFGNGFIQVIRTGPSQQVISAAANSGQDVFSISGSTLTIHLDGDDRIRDLFPASDYHVTISNQAIRDLAGNNLDAGIINTTDWNFTTELETVTWNAGAWSNGTGPTSNKHAIIDDNLSVVASDNAGGSFHLFTADLTINAGNTLTVDGGRNLNVQGNLINNGSITVESGSSIITYEGNSVAGNDVEIRRNTRYSDGKYSFVGTPVEQNASIVGSDLGTSVYKYNEMVDYDADGINRWEDASSDQLIPAKGYTQAFQHEIVFTGIPNDGTITYSGTYTEDDADVNEGWNLVANPYAAAIKVEDFLLENDHVSGSVYIWDDNGSNSQRGTNADYIVANATMASATAAGGSSRYNNHLGSAQGFFVKLDDNSDTDIVFTEDMRVTQSNGDANFFREIELPVARINLTNSAGLFKQTVIGFTEDAIKNELNKTYDAQAFTASANDGLFTMKAGRSLTLNGMIPDWEVIQLQMNTAEDGLFQIAIELEGYEGGLYLRDNLTGDITDLTTEGYTFTTSSGINTERFELLSSPSNVLGLEDSKVLVYAIEHTLHISQENNEIREYEIFNLNGKRLLTTT
ncbi:MAG: Ig-like domain-containing protein, partial [Ekhidna sp.]